MVIDLVLKQPKTTNDADMLKTLEGLALGCTLHRTATARQDYDMKVSDWINDFKGDLAFRKQRYLTHYLIKKYEYLNNKTR